MSEHSLPDNVDKQVMVDDPSAPPPGFCGKKAQMNKTILHSLTGVFRPGRLTAIMGASGAGKTTMLNVVSGEAAGGTISGRLLINGQPVESVRMLKRLSAFVFQDDVIMTTMTVREAIALSARLRLPGTIASDSIGRRVAQVISMLHLDKCADTMIGSPQDKGGVSGGERKRCAIGMELVTNPSILFLDEPTTGLDTYTAFSVIDTLRQLAMTGRTVVATIHQPSSDIFHLFDDLLVLAQGNIVYQGPCKDSVSYFGEVGFPCPRYANPADHLFMRVLNDTGGLSRGSESHESKGRHVDRVDLLVSSYRESKNKVEYEALARQPGPGVGRKDLSGGPGILTQVWALAVRNGRNIIRHPLGMRAKFAQSIIMGLIIALIYREIGDKQVSVQGRVGSLFFISMGFMLAAFGVLGAFSMEKLIFTRETALGMYTTESFYLTKTLTELPHNSLFPIMQMAIMYYIIGYQDKAVNFLLFAVIASLNLNCGNALGIFIAACFSDIRVTLIAAPPLILPLMVFSGMFINTDSIPVYLDWIKYLSPVNYAFRAFMKTEMIDLKLSCTDEELKANPACPSSQPRCFCPVLEGEQVLKSFNLDGGMSRSEALACLAGLYIAFTLLGYVALSCVVRSKNKRRAKHV